MGTPNTPAATLRAAAERLRMDHKALLEFAEEVSGPLADLLDSVAVEYDQPPCDAPEACNRCAEPDPVIIDALRIAEELPS